MIKEFLDLLAKIADHETRTISLVLRFVTLDGEYNFMVV